jgi:hypothetical protein
MPEIEHRGDEGLRIPGARKPRTREGITVRREGSEQKKTQSKGRNEYTKNGKDNIVKARSKEMRTEERNVCQRKVARMRRRKVGPRKEDTQGRAMTGGP